MEDYEIIIVKGKYIVVPVSDLEEREERINTCLSLVKDKNNMYI